MVRDNTVQLLAGCQEVKLDAAARMQQCNHREILFSTNASQRALKTAAALTMLANWPVLEPAAECVCRQLPLAGLGATS
jgi:hypothetical protein